MAGRLAFEINEDEATQTLVDRDAVVVTASVDVGEMARRAESSSGIPIKKLAKGMRALTGGNGAARGGVGQVNGVEYFRWRLYDVSKNERARFLSDHRQWEIEGACNDQELAERTVRKSECTAMLEAAGLPTIPIAGVVDRTGGEHGSLRHITTGEDLLALLGDVSPPVFAKPNQLLGSIGAFRVDEIEGEKVRISSDGWVGADDLVKRLIGDEVYLLQKVLRNHDLLAQLSPSLSTVRTVNLLGADDVATPFCIYKIPAAGNIADNFWRAGNLMANLDPATGEIVRVVTGIGGDQQQLTHHPDTGTELVGMVLPFWNELRELNMACCRLFSGVRYQTLDLAITNDGPVIVEVNSGGSFDLPQVATGRGVLTDQVRDFFEGFGVDLHSTP